MIGDGLMAVFGAPLPLADAPTAAVRSALDMLELIELLNVERAAVRKPPMHIGIGIASGAMIAGYTGTQSRATYTCVGNTVNLAARLEAHTKVAQRTILIDRATLQALPPDVQVEVLQPVALKGIDAAVEVYSIDGAQSL
jgi:class 3 adenylate cyclase